MNWIARQLFPDRARRAQVSERLFSGIMTKARAPELYERDLLPDTLEGRFHSVAIHSALVFRRLEDAGDGGGRLITHLNRRVFDSFDAALREMGIGDASIARKARKLGESFVGVGAAVAGSLIGDDVDDHLSAILERNCIAEGDSARSLSAWLVQAYRELVAVSDEAVLSGETGWAPMRESTAELR